MMLLTFIALKHWYCSSGNVEMITLVCGGSVVGNHDISLPSKLLSSWSMESKTRTRGLSGLLILKASRNSLIRTSIFCIH